jgi:hypothetical protein
MVHCSGFKVARSHLMVFGRSLEFFIKALLNQLRTRVYLNARVSIAHDVRS